MTKPTMDQGARLMIEGFSLWCYREGITKGPQDIETVRRHWNNFQRAIAEIAEGEGLSMAPSLIEVDVAGEGDHVH